MRRSCTISLVVVALLVQFDATSATNSHLTIQTRVDNVNDHSTRFLRVRDNEERGISAPSIEVVQGFLKKGLITDDVAGILSLGNAADDLLTASHLNAYVSYIKVFNKENPAESLGMIATLTTRFGDEALATMVEAAKKSRKTAVIAKQVQAEQIQHWLVAKKLPDDVFVLLKLNKEKTRLFAQPQINTWVKYVDEYNKANPESNIGLLPALYRRYDQETLVPMIFAAEKVSSTKNLAMRLQAEQKRYWLSVNQVPGDVFKYLQLDRAGFTILNNPLFSTWVKYTDDFRKLNPGTKLTTTRTLRKYYRDDVLTQMILKAGKSSSTSALSERLEAELLREWYLVGRPPLQVFGLLKLQHTNLKLLESPLFAVWTNYIAFFNKVEPKFKVDQFSMLTRIYGESYLARVLIAAEKVPSTKNAATALLKEQFNLLLAAKRDPRRVYFLWHVDRAAASAPNKLLYGDYVLAYTQKYRRNS